MSRWIDYAATFRYNLYTNRKQAVDLIIQFMEMCKVAKE